MARIPSADAPQYTPGTSEYTMGQEQRRQAKDQAKADEAEIRMLNEQLMEMMRDPSLSSSDRQEVSELMDDIFRSEFGLQEAGMGSFVKGAAQALGKQAKGAKAKILGGARTTAQGIKDRAKALTDRLRPKAEPGPKESFKDSFWKSMDKEKARRGVEGGLRKGAPITVPGMVGLEALNQFGGDEELQESQERPELPVTGVPEDQPEEIEDAIPTDQDIEGLFNGEGMPSKFAGRGDTEGAAYAAFLRERAKALGSSEGQIEGAPELYQEPGGIPWSETPEGKAFAAGDVMPPDPNAVASQQRMPGPGRPGVPMEVGEDDEPEAIPDAEGLDLSQLMPELDKTQRSRPGAGWAGMARRFPQFSGGQPEETEDDIPRPQQMPRPTLPMTEPEEGQPEAIGTPPQTKEDVLDAVAPVRPDQGPPTDDDIVGLFEGRNVPVSQLSEEEARTQFDEMVAKFEEQPELPLTEEDEKRFRELLGMFRK